MKNIFLTIILFSQCLMAFAQDQKPAFLSHYVSPEFSQGVVKKKNGSIEKASLNYNAVTQEIIFEVGDTKYALAEINTIDSVSFQSKKFIPVDSVFYEVVPVSSSSNLYVQHKCRVELGGADIGYGSKTQTTATTSLSSYNNQGSNRMMYNLQLPSEYKITPYDEYWLKNGNSYIKANNAKQIQKVYPGKEAEIKSYLKTNKPDLKNQADLIALLIALNK